jgi:Rrf2 family protein
MRLELSRRTDLALRALRLLDEQGGRMTRTDLAGAIGTSPDFAAKTLGPLVHAGWIGSEPGRRGGYELATDLRDRSVLELIRLTEGIPPEDRCVLQGGPCLADGPCALHDAWTSARTALFERLDQTPISAEEGP